MLFVDEIHRLSPVVEEILYPALEDFQLDIMIGEGPAARSIKLDLPPFTLVGATTRAGLLTSPLRDRFGIVQRLDFYGSDELRQIVVRAAGILGLPIDEAGATSLAQRSRGTPRIANRLLRRVRDYAEVRAAGHIDAAVAKSALDLLEVDIEGFDLLDRRFLLTVIEKFAGGPVGIDSLAATLGEERDTLEDVVEPFLIQQGFLVRSARGRMATPAAWRHFGREPPAEAGGGKPAAVSRVGAAVGTFTFPVRVYWEDTDAGGVVYYANYLRFLERARSEWLRTLGIDQARLLTDERLQFVVVEANIRYHRPAKFDDELVVTAALESLGGASVTFAQEIRRGTAAGELLVSATVRAACIASDTLKPRPLPKALTSQF